MDEIEIRLKNIAKNNNVTLEEVKKKFEEKKKELTIQGLKINIDRIAVNAVMNDYRKTKVKTKVKTTNYPMRKKKEVTIVAGFLVGDRGIWDKAETIRRKAKAYIDRNGIQAAIEAQLIDGDGNILDTREQIYGRENPNYLKPLPPDLHVRERTLYGFFIGTDGKWKYGSIQTNDNRLAKAWSKVKFFVPCTVPAIIKEETESNIVMTSSTAKETLSIFKAINKNMAMDIDIQKIIEETIGKEFTPINKVEEFHEKFKDAWDRRIFVKGIVAWIALDRPTTFGSIRMGLMDPDNEDELVIVEIPEHLSIDFGELSELIVFGTTRRSKHYNEDNELEEGEVIIVATGLFPIIATPKTDGRQRQQEEDIEIEGWLEEE